MKNKFNILVVGLGYVGLPLAIELGKKYPVLGYDIDKNRIKKLSLYIDTNNEFNKNEIKKSKFLQFTHKLTNQFIQNIIIVTLPTPINKKKLPDLSNIKNFNLKLSPLLKKNDIVIYESTVFPGCTEEIFVPQLESKSTFKLNKGLNIGYSPERVNPGDKKMNIKNISKIISASNRKTLNVMHQVYQSILKAKVYKAKSIMIAEAAKVIENTQRDINISFINELAIIFDKMNIDTLEVLKMASTKWNFLNFLPGLVGGHCIGVDPYYLAYKSKKIGVQPNLILAGRKINDNMANYIIKKINFKIKSNNLNLKNLKILLCGITFKPNVSDIRNSKALDILAYYHPKVKKIDIYDPYVKDVNLPKSISDSKIEKFKNKTYDVLIFTVAHNRFKKNLSKLKKSVKDHGIVVDLTNKKFINNGIKF